MGIAAGNCGVANPEASHWQLFSRLSRTAPHGRRVGSAFIATAFAQETPEAASTQVAGFFPNDDAGVRLFGALLLEENDKWAVQRSRYLSLGIIAAMSDDLLISLSAVAS